MDSVTNDYDAWIGHDVYDAEGDKVGEIKDVFYDDVTQRPEWLSVKGGLLSGTTLVPIQGATRYSGGDDDNDDDLQVTYTKDFIKGAPSVDIADDHMDAEQERRLWEYYEYDYDVTAKGKGYGYGKNYGKLRADADYKAARYNRQTSAWDAPGADESQVVAEATAVSEDVRKVEQAETVRLRKYQRTEMVPVTKEEVRVEKVPAGETTTATASTRTTRRPNA